MRAQDKEPVIGFVALMIFSAIIISVNIFIGNMFTGRPTAELSPIDTLHSELMPSTEDSLDRFRIFDAKMYEFMDNHAPSDSIRKYFILSWDIKPRGI